MKRLIVLCSLLLLAPAIGRAASPVYISEIAWAGSSSSTSDEWLELCGPAGTDISGWSIDGAGTGGSALVLPTGSTVPESGAFLISNYSSDDGKSTLAAVPDRVTTAVALSNSALFLNLRDGAGTSVDVAGVVGGLPLAGGNGALKSSMERALPLRDGGLAEAWVNASFSAGFDIGATELGTPGSCPASPSAAGPSAETQPAIPVVEPALPVPPETPAIPAVDEPHASASDTPDVPPASASDTPMTAPVPASASTPPPTSAVRISEAYPSPNSGETEWIELVNPSDVGEILDGWTIEDGKGTATHLSGTLSPWSRAVMGSPKGQLNNDGDLILLKDASGRVLDGVAYGVWDSSYPNAGVVKKGEALMREELQQTFAVTTTPTPGAANVLTRPPAAQEAATKKPSAAASIQPAVTVATAIPVPPAIFVEPKTIQVPAQASVPTMAAVGTAARQAIASSTVIQATSAAKKQASTSTARYKGDAFSGVIASPPGVYSKTRMFALIGGLVREVRLSNASIAAFSAGERVSFVAQAKTDGADAYLLANPNSFRSLDASASATFAVGEKWPESVGAYRLNAEVVSTQAGVLEAKIGGVEGDILAPPALTASLKPGDIVTFEGYISPGPRPRAVLSRPQALTLFKPYQAVSAANVPADKLPWQAAAGLTLLMAIVGAYAYLRHQRLQRLALTPVDTDEETW